MLDVLVVFNIVVASIKVLDFTGGDVKLILFTLYTV